VAGIVHRDLKPHNVFFAEEGGLRRWKILDFGVSKVGGSGTLTQGHVVGTPAYMAPEQARGEDVDHRADVYSLAAIIYRAVTGHPVFSGKDVPATLHDVVYAIPTRPSMLAQLPADVDRVLAIGLAKDPRERFAFALELARWFSAAVTQGLDVDQRRRADELIARYPWSARLGLPAGTGSRLDIPAHTSGRSSTSRACGGTCEERRFCMARILILWNQIDDDVYEHFRRDNRRAPDWDPTLQVEPGETVEQEIELIERALNDGGHTASHVNIRDSFDNLLEAVRREGPDCVVNLVEFFHDDPEQEHNVPALFELLNIPYTGNRPLDLPLCQKKPQAKALLASAGLPTPRGIVIERGPVPKDLALRYPMIVKPAHDDASGG